MAHENKMHFTVPAKAKTWTMIFMAIGVLSAALGWFSDKTDHHQYWWANVLVNSFFFFAVGLGALFFYALQYAAEVAWSAQLKRIYEAMFSYVLPGILIIIAVLLAGQLHLHHLYHWMDSRVYDPSDLEHYDQLIADKRPYLSAWFFWLRVAAYALTFVLFARYFRKWSLEEDKVGGTEIHFRMFRKSAVFLVLFAVWSSTMSWDWLMSIDTHWFSTMYGWYIFSGMWVTAMIFALLLVLWLRKLGYLGTLNQSHIHDMGKWVFAVSMLWSYLWFCQYMLIWYSNIPEEVTYFTERYEHYMYGMWAVFFVNFALPFYTLISRDAKRNPKYLVRVGIIIFISHFFDLYMAVIPGTIHGHLMWGMGEAHHMTFTWWFELGLFAGFLGLFVRIVLNTLSKARLVPEKHPYIGESEHHSI